MPRHEEQKGILSRAGVLDGRMKNPWSMAGVSSLPTQTPLPQFPHCAADIREPKGEGAVALKRTVRKSKAISFLLLARVACVKVRIKPVGVGAGSSAGCFVWRSRLAVASVAENIGSGHARLRSNPITPCGWAPKIAPVSPIITVQQRIQHRPLIVPGTQSSLTPPLPAAGTCSEPTLGNGPLLHHSGTQRCRGGLRARRCTHSYIFTPNLAPQAQGFQRI